MDIYIEFAKVP